MPTPARAADDPSWSGPEAFVDDVRGGLVGALTLYVGDRAVAEELAQEALVRAWQRWDRLSAPRAWVYRTAFNLARSGFRRRQAERRATRRAAVSDTVVDPDVGDAVAVRRAVAALAPRQREAIVARYYADLTVSEAAEAMGCAAGTVKALTSQAIANLRAAGLAVDPDPNTEEVTSDA